MIKILLVEDDDTIAFGIRVSLAKKGYEVTGCVNLAEAKQIFSKAFALVLLDLNLPDGMGGNEGKTCLKILVNWLLIGLAAGFWLTAAVTFWEYQNFAGFVGAAIGSAEEIEGEEGGKNDSQQAVIRRALAAALKAENHLEGAPLKEEGTSDKKEGEA